MGSQVRGSRRSCTVVKKTTTDFTKHVTPFTRSTTQRVVTEKILDLHNSLRLLLLIHSDTHNSQHT